MLTIKKEEEGLLGDDTKLFAWDEDFYLRLRKERDLKSGLDLTSVPEYFELDNTLRVLLGLYVRLFGTRFERISLDSQGQSELSGPLVWHEDVQMFAVWDVVNDDDGTGEEDDEFLGYAYFDLFPRDGKYGHRGCYALRWGYSHHQPQTGDGDRNVQPEGRFRPSCALVMNFPKPAEDGTQPTLLSLVDVRRLFHELGHLHHTLCTKVKYAGLSYIDRDFVEAPSLMLARFLWKPSYIKALAHHYSYLSAEFHDTWLRSQLAKKTNSDIDDVAKAPIIPAEQQPPPLKLPDRVIAELSDTNPKQFIHGQTFNLFLSLCDVLVHHPTTHGKLERMNLAAEFNKLQTEITGLHGGEAVGDGYQWEWAHGESVFRMIVSGYDAGYYSYLL